MGASWVLPSLTLLPGHSVCSVLFEEHFFISTLSELLTYHLLAWVTFKNRANLIAICSKRGLFVVNCGKTLICILIQTLLDTLLSSQDDESARPLTRTARAVQCRVG